MKQFYHITLLFIFALSTIVSTQAQAGFFTRKTDSIKIVYDQNQLVLPGEPFKVGVISYHKKGKIRKTMGLNGGTVLWWRYNMEVMGGKSSRGNISVSSKLYPSKGKYISVKVWPRKHEELAQTILVPLNFETDIEFVPSTAFDKAPGSSFKGQVVASFNNGVQRTYRNIDSHSVETNYNISTNGLIRGKNQFQIESDFRNIIDHKVDVWIRSKRNPAISTNYSILLDYKHKYNLAFRGGSGLSGFDGSNGLHGFISGNGSSGEHGYDGQPGNDGPDIGIWTDSYYDSILNYNLLYVYAENFQSGEEFYYLINPEGGSLHAQTHGGSGGKGGDGGNGGGGGRGADGQIWYETRTKTRIVKIPYTETVVKTVKKRRTTGTGKEEEYEEKVTEHITKYRNVQETYQVQIKHQKPGKKGGNGGDGGAGGIGGPGGWGGNIYLYFTDDATAFQNRIIPQSTGGSGASHGDGGIRGRGGCGGSGNPNGRSGFDGRNGPELSGWASDGDNGEVIIDSTPEFFFYEEMTATIHNTNPREQIIPKP